MRAFKYFLLSLLFLSSCDKFDWHNPYDPECPKELFTPSSPGATMEGNSVKLTWSQSNDDISGFALFRSAEGEPIANLTQTQKSTTQYLDASVTPGKKYTYYVLAVAGTNKSDTIKAEITPVFPITISTGGVTELAATSAKVSGNITSAGGGTVTSRGICWSTTQNPTVNNSKTTEGTGPGEYTSTLTGLLAGTTYYARAYGENSRGIVYGSQVAFTTFGLPTLTTTAVSNITTISATSGGTIISDGGSPITAKGIVWGTSPNPTIDLATKTNEGTGSGNFTSLLDKLIINTKYYVRAYATNNGGTNYGEEFSFIASLPIVYGEPLTDIDGNTYKTVLIGNKLWMAENLNVTRYRNGQPIQVGTTKAEWYITSPQMCFYNNDASISKKYGSLYNWYAVTDSRGLAPEGWHVATVDELAEIEQMYGGRLAAGGPLKEAGFNNWNTPNTGATNISGFSVVPGGARGVTSQDFSGVFSLGTLWSQTESWPNSDFANAVYFHYNNTLFESYNSFGKMCGLSVRCVKNYTNSPKY